MSKRRKCVETYYAIKMWPRSDCPYFAINGQNVALFYSRTDAMTFAKREHWDAQYSIKKVTLSD